jgi:hypothetical protein
VYNAFSNSDQYFDQYGDTDQYAYQHADEYTHRDGYGHTDQHGHGYGDANWVTVHHLGTVDFNIVPGR